MESEDVCSMENIRMRDGSTQQYGYVVYEITISKGFTLVLDNARDYVFVSHNTFFLYHFSFGCFFSTFFSLLELGIHPRLIKRCNFQCEV